MAEYLYEGDYSATLYPNVYDNPIYFEFTIETLYSLSSQANISDTFDTQFEDLSFNSGTIGVNYSTGYGGYYVNVAGIGDRGGTPEVVELSTTYPLKWTVTIDYTAGTITINHPTAGEEVIPLVEYPVVGKIIAINRIAQINFQFVKGSSYLSTVAPNQPPEPPNFSDIISVAGGGQGNLDTSSDTIGLPNLPSYTALTTNLLTMYNMTLQNISDFADFLWSDNFVDIIKKIYQNPMEAIIGLSMVNTPLTGVISPATFNVTVGQIDSGVDAYVVGTQFLTLDCGTISIEEFWGSALDYDPYTKIQIYLPYIGIRDLSVDDVMNSTVGVTYRIDLLTGASVCSITSTREGLNSILYHDSCNVNNEIPLSASDKSALIGAIVGVAASVGLGIATAGASTAATGAVAGTTVGKSLAGVASSVIGVKDHVQRSGRLDGSIGALGNKKPYIIITRPIQSLPENYGAYEGYPCNITKKLSDLTGYTIVDTVYMKGITATEDEIKMIEEALKGGVIL